MHSNQQEITKDCMAAKHTQETLQPLTSLHRPLNNESRNRAGKGAVCECVCVSVCVCVCVCECVSVSGVVGVVWCVLGVGVCVFVCVCTVLSGWGGRREIEGECVCAH